MSRSKNPVTVDGVQYKSRSAAAVALVAAGKSLGDAAKACGMTYQTVYSVTKGAEKVAVRKAKYRVLAIGARGKKSVGEIAKKVGVSTSRVVALLKAANIAVISADMKAKAKAEKSGKAPRAPKAPKVTKEVPASDILPQTVIDSVPTTAATAVTEPAVVA